MSRTKRPKPPAAPRPARPEPAAPVPKGRVTREMAAERLRFVAEIFARTKNLTVVVRAARKEFGISSSTTRRYLAQARAAWSEAALHVDLEQLRQEHRAGIIGDMNAARAGDKLQVVATLWRTLLELDQLHVSKVEVTTKRDPLAGMTAAQLRRYADTGLLPGEPGFDEELPALPGRTEH